MADLNVANRTLFHGDNLPFLRGLNSESVHLIATDPPFNKGRDFHATPDSLARGAKFQDRWSWDDKRDGGWLDQITDDWSKAVNVINAARESWGDDMGAFLCFMAVRLIEMYRVLRNDGSIYLHCDPTASHYLKGLMDAIFGKMNFRNEIIWHYGLGAFNATKHFARKHDILLFYTKSSEYVFNVQRGEPTQAMLSKYSHHDENGQYMLSYGKKYYMKGGKPFDTIWDIPTLSPTDKIERTGYPTQKPLALYERIINASSNEGNVVLDPFAGCATTPVAAERLGRHWVGADIWDGAHEMVLTRLAQDSRGRGGKGIWKRDINYTQVVPTRTDDAEEAVPFLQVTERYKEPAGPRMTRQEMFDHLITQNGQRCQGCDRTFDDPLYLELDHNTPRSQGGWNHIMNRVLLCGPCNRIKSNVYTLEGLRRENRRRGRMAR